MNYNEIKEELKKSQDNIKNFNYEKKEEEYYFEFKEKVRKFFVKFPINEKKKQKKIDVKVG